jgi:ABC-2 type transport system ATP-binding protein
MGMVGGSYGGGIQWVTAAQDCRIDAIVPTISWHSLSTSLYKTGLYKAGWGNLLLAAAADDHLDPHIRTAAAQGNATGAISAANATWFRARGPGTLVAAIHVPTLIVQGTVDTLFTLDEGITNYEQVRRDGVPVAMLWYCGGHGICLTDQGNPRDVEEATVAWLNRWVKRDTSSATGPAVDLIDQNGVRYAAATYPLPTTTPLAGTGSGTLPLVAAGGSGPVTLPASDTGSTNPLASVVPGILPARAANAVDVRVAGGTRTSLVVGAPTVTLTYRGTSPAGLRPERVFAQLVDDSSGLVVGNQVTPVAVELDGRQHTTAVALESVCQSVAPGQSLTLQLVATTVAYATPRLGGSLDVTRAVVHLPVAAPSSFVVAPQS